MCIAKMLKNHPALKAQRGSQTPSAPADAPNVMGRQGNPVVTGGGRRALQIGSYQDPRRI